MRQRLEEHLRKLAFDPQLKGFGQTTAPKPKTKVDPKLQRTLPSPSGRSSTATFKDPVTADYGPKDSTKAVNPPLNQPWHQKGFKSKLDYKAPPPKATGLQVALGKNLGSKVQGAYQGAADKFKRVRARNRAGAKRFNESAHSQGGGLAGAHDRVMDRGAKRSKKFVRDFVTAPIRATGMNVDGPGGYVNTMREKEFGDTKQDTAYKAKLKRTGQERTFHPGFKGQDRSFFAAPEIAQALDPNVTDDQVKKFRERPATLGATAGQALDASMVVAPGVSRLARSGISSSPVQAVKNVAGKAKGLWDDALRGAETMKRPPVPVRVGAGGGGGGVPRAPAPNPTKSPKGTSAASSTADLGSGTSHVKPTPGPGTKVKPDADGIAKAVAERKALDRSGKVPLSAEARAEVEAVSRDLTKKQLKTKPAKSKGPSEEAIRRSNKERYGREEPNMWQRLTTKKEPAGAVPASKTPVQGTPKSIFDNPPPPSATPPSQSSRIPRYDPANPPPRPTTPVKKQPRTATFVDDTASPNANPAANIGRGAAKPPPNVPPSNVPPPVPSPGGQAVGLGGRMAAAGSRALGAAPKLIGAGLLTAGGLVVGSKLIGEGTGGRAPGEDYYEAQGGDRAKPVLADSSGQPVAQTPNEADRLRQEQQRQEPVELPGYAKPLPEGPGVSDRDRAMRKLRAEAFREENEAMEWNNKRDTGAAPRSGSFVVGGGNPPGAIPAPANNRKGPATSRIPKSDSKMNNELDALYGG